MNPPRWTIAHVGALVEAALGVGVLVYFVVLGVEPFPGERSPVDVAFPFVVGVGVGGALILSAVRRWRRAGSAPSPPRPVADPVPGPSPAPAEEEPVEIDEGDVREVARIVDVLVEFGVLTPGVRELRPVYPAAAVWRPITAGTVLALLDEQTVVHPELPQLDGAVFHDNHVEQFEDYLARQVDDLLALGGLDDVAVRVELSDYARVMPTTLHITGDGPVRTVTYDGAAKYLSTVLHVEVARIVLARGERRLAWTWLDQGVWITALAGRDVDDLNADLGSGDGFTWVDVDEPVEAGAMYRT